MRLKTEASLEERFMKILYIDTRSPGHNAELHVDFIKFMHDKGFCEILPYGNRLRSKFSNAISINEHRVSGQLDEILLKHKPDAILTYNKNGSSYKDLRDNISLYKWVEEALSNIDVPKFHVTTDYCRSGYREEQSKWFEDLGYTAAIFRHRESLKYPCGIESFWLPFSVDASLYAKFNKMNYFAKRQKVSFLGTALQNPSLYRNRVAAINALEESGLLATSRVVDKVTGYTQMIIGVGYQRFLSKHMFGLTCGGTCNYMTAKHFQIPAARSMLICSDTNGLDLFPEDTYIKYSAENVDKLCSDVEYYIKNRKEAKEKTMILTNHVLRNHNHRVRAEQFISFLKAHL